MPLVLVVEEVTEEERPLGLLQVPGVILCETDRLSNCDFYLELRLEGCPDFNKVEGSQEMASMAGAVPAVEQRKEYDPWATPDVDKLNAAYLALPSMEVPFWAGPCGREPHQSHSKHRLLWKNLFYLSVSNWFWCANVTETKTIISKKTAVPEGNPGKFCFCT